MTISTPDWVKDAVFYQIFPDRFARSPRTPHPKGITFAPWRSPAEDRSFQGGDLLGIVDRLDYLVDLGINALYLNPIFSAGTEHRYDAYDYLQVDPLLGGDAALRELLDAAHDRDIRVVLDGVFNHCGRGFWPFLHVLENGERSPYRDWFIIHDWPIRPYSYGDDHTRANYAHWARFPVLPKLNTDNQGVREYLMGVARHWLEFGIDGWRLDVPYEIDDDGFWQEFRQVVKSVNPEAYIVGEIWDPAPGWLQGDQWDAVMNYPFAFPTLCFCGAETLNTEWRTNHWTFEPLDAPAYAQQIERVHALYDWEINQVQFNLLDSHDTARALHIMGGDKRALRLAVLLQMTMPGAPCIYYGDEIGLSSLGDPFCREAFPWQEEEIWDREMLDFYRSAIALRHSHPALRTGAFQTIHAADDVYAFVRQLDGEEAVVFVNAASDAITASIDLSDLQSSVLTAAWPLDSNTVYQVIEGRLDVTLPPREAVILVNT